MESRPICGKRRCTCRSWATKGSSGCACAGCRARRDNLQSEIGAHDTRYTPRLRFELDEGVKKSLAISQMLHELLPDTNASPEATSDETDRDE